ncbi:unnamed protein product [Cuscuta campestris]|uniref:Replication protein A 70 kDa DNA-binding subunit B/D first OB fold domain-containing protein n=1 Tax=Cuscuta campestris TaxID=132261 RepID=A0A484N8P0_9ASTE|nr:unnamed protein product [Cuscuta campestris]
MVFMDEHGSTIHATVRRSLVGTFGNRIKEGSVYVFAYFGIGNSTGYYRTSRHEFRLNFQPRTTITECSCENIPVYGLKLVPFPEISKADANYPYLIDTMGTLTSVGNEKEIVKESKRTKMIAITIEAEGNSGVGMQRQPLKWTCDDAISSRETEFLDTSRSMAISQLKACLECMGPLWQSTIAEIGGI